jgi:hypothetical protein
MANRRYPEKRKSKHTDKEIKGRRIQKPVRAGTDQQLFFFITREQKECG